MTELVKLYREHFGIEPGKLQPLGGAASNRRYVRISAPEAVAGVPATVIGVVGENLKENHAFIALARHMYSQGLNVPQIYAVSGDEMRYLQQDLGTVSLYDILPKDKAVEPWPQDVVESLHRVMRDLPRVQYLTARGFDFEKDGFREPCFNDTTVSWDLNYFKYCFVKLTGYQMDEIRLEQDFNTLHDVIMQHDTDTSEWPFLYRDFQSRNVMIAEQPYYIDFQGGYRGPVYYDVASFLWQTRAAYPSELRMSLLRTYVEALQDFVHIGYEQFHEHLGYFVIFRLLQTLGTYGYRGMYEHKTMFLDPIIASLKAVAAELRNFGLTEILPYITELFDALLQMPRFQPQASTGGLTVRVTSFSYKKGIPEDYSGNGGGFVFDCRAPHNPGRYKEYKKLTGMDQPVIDFLEGKPSQDAEAFLDHTGDRVGSELLMPEYMEHVYAIVDPAIETYLRRGFTSLMVSFGCTGGQHRSVYGAEHMAAHIREHFPEVNVILTHREQT